MPSGRPHWITDHVASSSLKEQQAIGGHAWGDAYNAWQSERITQEHFTHISQARPRLPPFFILVTQFRLAPTLRHAQPGAGIPSADLCSTFACTMRSEDPLFRRERRLLSARHYPSLLRDIFCYWMWPCGFCRQCARFSRSRVYPHVSSTQGHGARRKAWKDPHCIGLLVWTGLRG